MTSNGENRLQLYTFYLSPPSFSVRIALNLKGLEYECKPINLNAREQFHPEFIEISPMGYVPALTDGDMVLADSFAILMYLEEKYPEPPMLPRDLEKKAINYQAANIVSTSIQAILKGPIVAYLRNSVGRQESIAWVHKHLGKGFADLEILLKDHVGMYATGDEISLADVLLAPYVTFYTERYNFDMSGFLLLCKLRDAYLKVPAIQDAMPEKQSDFPVCG